VTTPFSLRHVVSVGFRKVPRAPFRFVLPHWLLRGPFRFWLSVLAAQPDRRKAVTDLLELHEDTRKLVGRAAIAYEGGVHVKHRLTRYHDYFVDRIHADEHVLDVGSGKGELAHDIASRAGATVVGLDNNPVHLAFARDRFAHERVTFEDGDVLENVPRGHFDVVVLSNVLEHFEHRVILLRRLVASTTPSRVLLRVPLYSRDWIVPLREEVGLSYFSDPTHHVEYEADGFRRELTEAGLDVTELIVAWGEIWATAKPAAA
jgi:2-polyprenyl-3-methyl-5-hydroxy-6-metoxy-1,4-benzoquinol methylase